MPSRLRRIREAAAKRATASPIGTPITIPAALVDAIGAQKEAATGEGRKISRDLQATLNRDEVSRLSLAGLTVAEIAAKVGLSYGHVSKIRSLMGVARRR